MNLSINNILLDKYIDLNNYITDNPKISVVIPVYNGEKYIKSALTSIQNQDLKDIEIIMIDDFSDDNSVIDAMIPQNVKCILLKSSPNVSCTLEYKHIKI